MNPMWLAAVPILLPLSTFLVIALVWPFRHTGRPAALLSTLAAILSAVAAVLLLPLAQDTSPQVWSVPWLMHDGAAIASVGLRVDAVSS